MRIEIDPAQVARTFAGFQDNPSFRESAQLFAQGRAVLEMLQAMSMSPKVLQAFAAFESVYPGGGLERGVMEKVILRVSQLHECQFCVNSHLDIMRSLGIGTDLDKTSDRETLAIEYAESVTRDSIRVPDSLIASLKTQFTAAEIVELTFLIGLITLLNRFNNALGVRYHGELQQTVIR